MLPHASKRDREYKIPVEHQPTPPNFPSLKRKQLEAFHKSRR